MRCYMNDKYKLTFDEMIAYLTKKNIQSILYDFYSDYYKENGEIEYLVWETN